MFVCAREVQSVTQKQFIFCNMFYVLLFCETFMCLVSGIQLITLLLMNYFALQNYQLCYLLQGLPLFCKINISIGMKVYLAHLFQKIHTMAPAASKKSKKQMESINSRLALVMKSGKYKLGYKQTLRTTRSGKAKLVIIAENTPSLRSD